MKKIKILCTCMISVTLVFSLCACEEGKALISSSMQSNSGSFLEQSQSMYPIGSKLTIEVLEDDMEYVKPNIANAIQEALIADQEITEFKVDSIIDQSGYQLWKITLRQRLYTAEKDIPYNIEFEVLIWRSERFNERYFAVCEISDPVAFSNEPTVELQMVSAWTEIDLLSPVKDNMAVPCVAGVRIDLVNDAASSLSENSQNMYTLVNEIALVDMFRMVA